MTIDAPIIIECMRRVYKRRRHQWGNWACARYLRKLGYTPEQALMLMGIKRSR